MNSLLEVAKAIHAWMAANPEMVAVLSAALGAGATNVDTCIGMLVDSALNWPWLADRVLADPARAERLIDRISADVKAAIEKKAAEKNSSQPKP